MIVYFLIAGTVLFPWRMPFLLKASTYTIYSSLCIHTYVILK